MSIPNRATIGKILALAVLLAALLATSPAHASTTFTVTNTNDSGAGSLRRAILDANATPGADAIDFAIPQNLQDPSTGVATIAPDLELPQITEAVTIDGYTQSGASPNSKAVGSDAALKIELSGAGADAGTGLYITAANSTVRGLVINGWTHGVILGSSGATGNKITGNYLGTDALGTKDLGNRFAGVYSYQASDNVIGGTSAGERNVISGNDYYGVLLGTDAAGNRIVGNYIGTDASGKGDLGNSSDGVSITGDGATGNRVLSNSIYSNGGQGIELVGSSANDPGDVDTGANDLQNHPVLSSATTSATSTTLQGTLNSTPGKTFTLQFFSNPAGADEGRSLIGETSVTTDAGGNTSEFSAPMSVIATQNTSPTISSLKPTPGSTTRDRTPTVGAKVTDAETDLARSNIKLYMDGNRRDFSYDRSTDRLSFTPGTNLSFGGHTVKIVATDASAMTSTKSWSFKVVR